MITTNALHYLGKSLITNCQHIDKWLLHQELIQSMRYSVCVVRSNSSRTENFWRSQISRSQRSLNHLTRPVSAIRWTWRPRRTDGVRESRNYTWNSPVQQPSPPHRTVNREFCCYTGSTVITWYKCDMVTWLECLTSKHEVPCFNRDTLTEFWLVFRINLSLFR